MPPIATWTFDMQRHARRLIPMLVAFALPALAAPSTNGDRLAEQVRLYKMTVQLDGPEDITFYSKRTWTKARVDGRDAWRVTVETESEILPTSVDTTLLTHPGLRPLRRSIMQGDTHIELTYRDDSVVGTASRGDGQEAPINVALQTVVVGDVHTAIAVLPLEPGFATVLHAYQPGMNMVRRWKVDVAGDEVLTTPLGQIETYRIELSDAGAPSIPGLYWVTRSPPHHLVRSEAKLPDAFGGGSEIAVLQSVTPEGLPAHPSPPDS